MMLANIQRAYGMRIRARYSVVHKCTQYKKSYYLVLCKSLTGTIFFTHKIAVGESNRGKFCETKNVY